MPTPAYRPKTSARPHRAKSASKRRAEPMPALLGEYWSASRSPLTSLLFVLPLLALHEAGVHWYATLPGRVVEYRITAFTLLSRFFQTCGATGRYLPALAVVAILLSWHIARGDGWRFHIPLLPLMMLESLLLALPLLVVYFLFSPQVRSFQSLGEWKLL